MNPFQDLFDAHTALFATGVTRTFDWRFDQLDRMATMIGENEHRFQKGSEPLLLPVRARSG